MPENTWKLQDGRAILVQFETAQAEANWGWFGMRGSGEGVEFAAGTTAWTNHDWLVARGMVMPGDSGGTTETLTVTKADLALAGKVIPLNQSLAVTKASPTLTGKVISLNQRLAITKAMRR